MADLIIYDSSRIQSKVTCMIALQKYPNATIKDTAGLALSTINTWIGNLDAAEYDKIISCVDCARVEEVAATAVVTVGTAGASGDLGSIFVDEGDGAFCIGSFASAGGGDAADAVLAKNAINAGTAEHGFTADNADEVLTITAPDGVGAAGNAYAVTVDMGNSDTLVLAVTTDFDSTGSGSGTGVTAVGNSGDLSEAYFIDLEAKAANEALLTGTAQGAGTGNNQIQLAASGPSAVDDYYNGKTIMIDSATGADQHRTITDYNGTTKTATVDADWGTNPDATSTYIISNDVINMGKNLSDVAPPRRVWQEIIQAKNTPTLLLFMGGDLGNMVYRKFELSSTAMAADSLSDTSEFTANEFDQGGEGGDYYLAIKVSDDGGVGQVRKIASNTVTKLTLAQEFNVTPAAASTYVVMKGSKFMLYDEYLPLALGTYLDFSGNTIDSDVFKAYQKLVDRYADIPDGNLKTFEDLEYLEELAGQGKIIYDAIAQGVVS